MVVFLTSDAFISLIVSSIEIYRKEAAGILTGDYIFNSDTYYIKGAIPLQSANRKFSEVEYHLARTQRMRENLELCLSDFVGYFHSHPQYFNMKITSELSQADKDSMEEGDFEIIVSIKDLKRYSLWVFKKKTMELSGCVGNYALSISAYSRDDDLFSSHKLICPFTDILSLFRQHNIKINSWNSINKNTQRKLRRLISSYEEAVLKNHNGESILHEISKILTRYM
ncbi:MAG: hypothetical protein ACFFCD_08200 [Promethearchaeota archaeon]